MPLLLHVHHRPVRNARRRVHANPLRVDPTRTLVLRKQFMTEMRKAFRNLKKEVIKFILTLDALGLDEKKGMVPFGKLVGNIQPREYEFRTDSQKLSIFNDWFRQQVEAHVLSPDPGTPHGVPWTTEFVESAYKRGMINAYLSSKEGKLFDAQGIGQQTQEQFLRASFGAPEAMSKVQMLGTRAWEGMKGITTTMGSQMNLILAQGMVDGSGAEAIAREMEDKINGLVEGRGMTIARTEIINAHAEGQLDAFEKLGVEELGIKAEWSTAGDDRVCEECEPMEGQVFTVEEAHGLIPLHPNCRCTWIPAEADAKTTGGIDRTAAGGLSVEAIQVADEMAATLSRGELETNLQLARAAFNLAKKAGVTGDELAALQREVWRSNRALWKFKQIAVAPPPPGPVPLPIVPKPIVPTPAPSLPVVPTPAEIIPPKPIAVPEPVVPKPAAVTKWTEPAQYREDMLAQAAKITEDPQYRILKQKAWDAYFEYQKVLSESRTGALDEVSQALRDAKVAQTRIVYDEAAEARRVMGFALKEKADDVVWKALVEENNLVSKVALPNVDAAFSGPMEDILSLMPEGRATAQELVELNRLTMERRAMDALGEYNPSTTRIGLRPLSQVKEWDDESKTIAHEFGHHISYKIRSIMEAQNAFFEKRTAGEKIKSLGGGLKASIKGKKDLFGKTRAYAGRVYPRGEYPEVISVGVELLWKDAVAFAKADPEYFDAIVKMLKGL